MLDLLKVVANIRIFFVSSFRTSWHCSPFCSQIMVAKKFVDVEITELRVDESYYAH